MQTKSKSEEGEVKMGDLKDLSVEEFAALTASAAPVPGGGSVAALAGALSAALAEMVASLTVGREKYVSVETEMEQLLEAGGALRRELIEGIRKDSQSFGGYMAALKLPRETEEEKELRRKAMQEGLKEASCAPLAIAEAAAKIFPIARAVVEKGNSAAISDGLISAMLARTAVLAALLNVKINLGSIRDEEYVRETAERVRKLEQQAISGEAEILGLSKLSDMIL
jgi:formiminotetrahydrofolate cyclodeaminase